MKCTYIRTRMYVLKARIRTLLKSVYEHDRVRIRAQVSVYDLQTKFVYEPISSPYTCIKCTYIRTRMYVLKARIRTLLKSVYEHDHVRIRAQLSVYDL